MILSSHQIFLQARAYIDKAYARTIDLLKEHRDEVKIVAEELLKNEVLTKEDMVRLLGPRPFDEKDTYEQLVEGTGGDLEDISGVIMRTVKYRVYWRYI